MWEKTAKADLAKVREAFGAKDYDKLPPRDRNIVVNAINDAAQGSGGALKKAHALLSELNPALAAVFSAQLIA